MMFIGRVRGVQCTEFLNFILVFGVLVFGSLAHYHLSYAIVQLAASSAR